MLDITGPVSPQGRRKIVLASMIQILDSFYAVHGEAKFIHDDEKLIMIYAAGGQASSTDRKPHVFYLRGLGDWLSFHRD